jgi:hypothetical protein
MFTGPRLAASLLGVSLLLGGCGGSAGLAPPTGVDGLQIPTASPSDADFVAVVDNPWLPLAPGTEWTYDISSDARPAPVRAVVRVRPDPVVVAGVPTTQVETVVTDARGRTLRTLVASYAQDRDGNVWLFGEQGSERNWRAEERGAQAGLAMAAHPRVGDGYRVEDAPGVAEDRARVSAVDAGQIVDGRAVEGLLLIQTSTALVPGQTGRQWYQRGQGLLLADLGSADGTERWTLADFRPAGQTSD